MIKKTLWVSIILFSISFIMGNQKSLAVLDFKANNINEGDARALTDRFRIEIFQLGKYKVVERELLEEILAEQGLQETGCTTDECIVEIGRLIGVQEIISGSISLVGNTFSVSARMIDVSSGEIICVAVHDHSGQIDGLLKEGMEKIALKLIGYENSISETNEPSHELIISRFTELISLSDEKHKINEYDTVYEYLKQAEIIEPSNFEVIWRLARAHYDFSDNSINQEVINRNLYSGLRYAEKALNIGEDRAKSHKWYGILIGRVGEVEGTEQKIKNSYPMAEHTKKAIELDPEDAGNYHVMGRWHYALASLTWFERQIASWVYATPPKASFEEARYYFNQAIDKDPEDIRNYLWLGKAYEELNNNASARTAYQKVLSLKSNSESDRIVQQAARDLLSRL